MRLPIDTTTGTRASSRISPTSRSRWWSPDASIVAMAERLKVRRIATTDRRDFARVRPRHVDALELVP
jgi:predicted nucleic acid-binding protein